MNVREQGFVLAAIRLWGVNEKSGCIPDIEVQGGNTFGLTNKDMIDIRTLVQEIKPRRMIGKMDKPPSKCPSCNGETEWENYPKAICHFCGLIFKSE